MSAVSVPTPARKDPRIEALDALRGIALLGILFVNFPFFAMPDGSLGSYIHLRFPSRWDRLANFLTQALCDGKFILIFSFLFGWGFHSQMRFGATPEGRSRFFRRLIGLLLIGLLHACFLFVGDILVTYAILGVPLFWARKWEPRKLLIAASGAWLGSILGHLLLGLVPLPQAESLETYQSALRIHTQGTFSQIASFRIEALIGLYIITPLLFMPQVFGMFLVGLAAAKEHERTGMDGLRNCARILLVALWLPALVGNVAYPYMNALASQHQEAPFGVLGLGGRALFAPMLTLVYLAIASLCLDHPIGIRWTKLLAGEGRSTLSLYVGESIIMGFLFNSYGLAWYGQVGSFLGIVICLNVYIVLLLMMNTWLRFSRIGPLEWVLRCITEWQWIAIKKDRCLTD